MTRLGGRTAAAALALLLSAALPAFAQEPEEAESTWFRQHNVGYGPFRQTSLSAFSTLRLPITPRMPSSLPAGAFEIDVQSGWAKDFSVTQRWDIDFEVVASDVAFAWGLSDRLRLDMEIVSGERTGGGGLDPLIIGFHNTFGLTLGNRGRHSASDYVFDIAASDAGSAVHVDRTDPQPFVESVLFSLQHTLTYGDEAVPAICWSVSLRSKLGGGGDLEEATPLDLIASVSISKSYNDFRAYLGVTAGWYGRDDFFGLKLNVWQWSILPAVEWNCLTDFSLVLQCLITSGAMDGLADYSRPSFEVAGGFKWEFARGMLFEAALIENIVNFENSPDLGFHFGLNLRW